MTVSRGRRRFVTQIFGLTTMLSLVTIGATVPVQRVVSSRHPFEETYHWGFTNTTRCIGGYIEEQWCYYECAGGACTPLQYEWRQTTRPC